MMKRRRIFTTIAALLLGTAAFAVLNERSLEQTLAVLRDELGSQNARMENARARMQRSNLSRHSSMVDMVQRSNELALMLYSQNQDFTFDVTYSLKAATKEYEEFAKKELPFKEIIERLDIEIDRYERLLEALRRLPPEIRDSTSLPDMPDSVRAFMPLLPGDTLRPRRIPPMGPRGTILPPAPATNGSGGPFVLDSLSRADRDSCILYASNLLAMYKSSKLRVTIDSTHYNQTASRLKDANDYAQQRYRSLQKRIFVEGQDDFLTVLKSLRRYSERAFEEARAKYDTTFGGYSTGTSSDWRGPIVTWFIIYVLLFLIIASALSWVVVTILEKKDSRFRTEDYRRRKPVIVLLIGAAIFTLTIFFGGQFVHQNFFREASKLLLVFAALLIAIMGSLLIHMEADKVRGGIKLYMPIILLGLVVITFRIIFIPNRLVNLILAPVLLGFTIWQAALVKSQRKKVKVNDVAYSGTTLFIMVTALVMALLGYVLMSIQLLIWWLFQLTALCALTAIHDLMDRYEERYIVRKLQAEGRHFTKEELKKGEFIRHTWLFDFVKTALVPALTVVSIPLCIYWASGVFDLTAMFKRLLSTVFYSISDSKGNDILRLSVDRIVTVTALYFFFRYAAYVMRAFYKKYKIASEKRERKVEYIRDNEVNLTLANNVIGIIVWGSYIIMFVMVFRIPMGALSIVAAGLATGLGLAMKDILNNFIYGMQLMSGRLRVGDRIECEGIRGKVANISYQSTQIEAEDGSLIVFTNTTLFNKNFKNLTRNSPYEYAAIMVGISYGSDVEKARTVLLQALRQTQGRDKFGRELIEPKYGIKVTLDDMAESSLNLKIKQFVIVEEKYALLAKQKELIYNTLNENGISIPFPQRDIHIIQEK